MCSTKLTKCATLWVLGTRIKYYGFHCLIVGMMSHALQVSAWSVITTTVFKARRVLNDYTISDVKWLFLEIKEGKLYQCYWNEL